jgi:UDP-glucose:(heptosyl)LPS alpha-1,3-glucosyltransferase
MESNVQKIAIVIPKYGLVGGAEGFAARLTERIAQNRNYEVHVFANKWADDPGGITFHRIPIIPFPKFMTSVSFAYYAGMQISKTPFDLIHAHDRIFAADLFTMHGIPHKVWISKVRRKKHMSLFDRGTQWVEKRLVSNERCKLFHAVSSLTKEKFLQEYSHINPERVRVIHPGVELSRFQKYDRQLCRNEIRKRFNLNENDRVILFVSMNFDIRGLDRLIKGIARLKAIRPPNDVKLLVVGKGNTKKYSSLAQDLGIMKNVVFAGIADRETLDKIYLASDMFSILSEFDTFSMTTLEAMAASLPVMISGNVGAKDLIKEGINGFVINDTTNADEIADRINRMLDDSIRSGMAGEAFRTASTQTWEATAGKIEEIYDEILRSRDNDRPS